MNSKRNISSIAGAVATLAVLFSVAACGNETVRVTDAPNPGRIYPPTDIPEVNYGSQPPGISADAAEAHKRFEENRLGPAGGY